MPLSEYDHLFGGKQGAAEKAKQSMERSYGKRKGTQIFYATVWKREARAKRARGRGRKTKARCS